MPQTETTPHNDHDDHNDKKSAVLIFVVFVIVVNRTCFVLGSWTVWELRVDALYTPNCRRW